MKAVEFPEQTVVIAKNQKEYLPLPAMIDKSTPSVQTVTCWRLSLRERLRILWSGYLWCSVSTFGHSYHPTFMSTKRSEVINPAYSKLMRAAHYGRWQRLYMVTVLRAANGLVAGLQRLVEKWDNFKDWLGGLAAIIRILRRS
jgi:hypothetical protein